MTRKKLFQDIRGNLNTRLRKLDDENGVYSAIILAVAGRVSPLILGRGSLLLVPDPSPSRGGLGTKDSRDE